MGQPNYVNGFEVTIHEHVLKKPLRWKKPRKIFVCSMSDLFHEDIEILDSTFVREIFAIMALCPQHTFQVLTKRPHVARAMLTDKFADSVRWAIDGICAKKGWGWPQFKWPLPNVWLGVSVEKQDYLWRVDDLLAIPAAIHFVSIEPMLEAVLLQASNVPGSPNGPWPDEPLYSHSYLHGILGDERINWVIIGGETGPNRRPFKVEWALDIYQQCKAAGVPFFGKQDSGARPGVPLVLPGIGEVKEWPNA